MISTKKNNIHHSFASEVKKMTNKLDSLCIAYKRRKKKVGHFILFKNLIHRINVCLNAELTFTNITLTNKKDGMEARQAGRREKNDKNNVIFIIARWMVTAGL